MSNLYSGLRQQAMSPMYGMSQPQSGFIPGGSYDPYQGMGGYGGGFGGGFPGMGGGYSMFGSYNAMPDYTGGYMPGYGSQLPSQFGGGVSQFGGMSQFGGGFGGYGMQPMQPNVNDLFGQYMFGQYYGQPSFNPFQATSMFGAGGGRGFGGGQRRGSREQFGGMQQPGGEAGFATTGQGFGADDYRQMANVSARQQSPFEGLELDIDALRAALGLSGQSPASPTAQITPSDDMSRGAAQAPAVPAAPTRAQAQTGTGGGSSRTFTGPNALMDAFNAREQERLAPATPQQPPMAPPAAPIRPPMPTQPPMQIPPNLNLFVPGFAGFDEGAGRQVQAPVETVGFAPPPTQAVLPETGGEGRFYTEQPTFSMTVQPTPVAQMPEFAPVAQPPTTMPQFSMGAMDNLAAARQAALMARQRGRG
jgi:hypothetical protein